MKMLLLILAVSSVLFLSIGVSNRKDASHYKQSKFVKGTSIDTVFHNDSMFSILSYKEGALSKIELKQLINPGFKNRAFGIQEISFFKNGRIKHLNATCRDTIINTGAVAYEEQKLHFDSLNRLASYMLMENFVISCRK